MSPSSDAVGWCMEDALAILTLNRPQTRNSLRVDEMAAVGVAVDEMVAAGARAVLIRGEGGAFCAGRDLKETNPETDDTLSILRDRINPALQKVRDCLLPTIAAVDGPALGFGFGLALACDITIVADDALLGSPFRNIGAVLDSGGHYYLRERVGRHRAAEIIFTGRLLSGREAAVMGLVNRSVGALDLAAIAQRMARDMAAGPTAAFRASKKILAQDRPYEEVAAMEAACQAEVLAGADGMEGIRAFQEKRRPRFVGR